MPTKLGRAFGGMQVRYKLMILHNLFFAILGALVWFVLVPPIETFVESDRRREIGMIGRLLAGDPGPALAAAMASYGYREGTASDLGIPATVLRALESAPGQAVSDSSDLSTLYARDPRTGLYRRVSLPLHLYDSMLRKLEFSLVVVLGVVYLLAVLVLEAWLMPSYIYRPIRMLLKADEASRRGDTEHELIDQALMQEDELGRVMRSRNATLQRLRQTGQDLQNALAELKEAAEDLRKKNLMLETAKEKILAQDRLASLGLLSASVAHELNTPLAVLSGSIERLLETVQDAEAQERLARMSRVTRRLQALGESLIGFARVRDSRPGTVPIRPLIEDSWGMVAIDERAAGVHFANHTGDGDCVLGDTDRLVQLFVNLLRNALHAAGPGGHIRVVSERGTEGGQEWVVIAVEDDGPGIPSDVLPDIFKAFVTTRLDARGTGLGLTVAEGIVQQHGGAISASNRPPGGARLEVRLPAAPSEVARPPEGSAALDPKETSA